MRFTTILASRIINNAILPLDSEDRANVLIIDDSMFERNRSKKVELNANVTARAEIFSGNRLIADCAAPLESSENL